MSNTASDINLYQKSNENVFRIKQEVKTSILLRINELYVQFHLSETVSDRTKKIISGLMEMIVLKIENICMSAKTRKYTHIELTSCSSWTRKNTFGVIRSGLKTWLELGWFWAGSQVLARFTKKIFSEQYVIMWILIWTDPLLYKRWGEFIGTTDRSGCRKRCYSVEWMWIAEGRLQYSSKSC